MPQLEGTGLSWHAAGPVDGPAIFDNVMDSQVAVAAQQFQASRRLPTCPAKQLRQLGPQPSTSAASVVACDIECNHGWLTRLCVRCAQVRNSTSTEFGLYCATKPTIEHSSDLRFTCWMGAYPGLTEHFEKANLDPKSNQWNKVGP